MPKVWGSGVFAVLLVSLFIAALPASAGTLEFSPEIIPSTSGMKLVPTAGMNIIDFAVASNGTTIYAVMGTGGTAASQKLYKSTDGGFAWHAITTPNNAATDAVNLVAVAPDDPGTIVVLGDISPATGNATGYVSTNGGATFDNLNIPEGQWYDVTVAPANRGIRYIGISGSVIGPVASFQYFNLGSAVPRWTDAVCWVGGGFAPSATSIRSAAFSPSFALDKTLVAVSEETGAVGGFRFHIANMSIQRWDTAAGFIGYPVTLTAATVDTVNIASISLDPGYLGSDDASRLAFVGASITETVTGREIGGTWRLTNTDVLPLNVFIGIKSVAWNGGTLVAGTTASNAVYYFEDLLTISPTIDSTPTFKRPGGTDNVIVAWAGTNVVAGTAGAESAFSISRDDAKSFNDVSLINTAIANLEDLWVTKDASKVYLVTDNGANTSLWRRTDIWERVLVLKGSTGYIARGALDNKDIVYLAKISGNRLYFTADGGDHNWAARVSVDSIRDLAVQDDSIAYVAVSGSAEVSKSTNAGFTWDTPVATNLASGNVNSIRIIGPNRLLVGSTGGYVSYSTDGNANWTTIDKEVGDSGLTQVTASGLATGDFIYATTNAEPESVYRWTIGTNTSWDDIIVDDLATYDEDTGDPIFEFGAYGIELVKGTLYVLGVDTDDEVSAVWRTLSPATATDTSTWSKKLTSDSDDILLMSEPQALKVSTGSIKLWAIDTNNTGLYSFTDTLADTPPTVVGPAMAAKVRINPVTGRAQDVTFTWSRLSNATKYDLQIAMDSGFTQVARTVTKESSDATVTVILGPFSEGGSGEALEWQDGATYYWKVRTSSDGPLYSPYSAAQNFTVDLAKEQLPPVTLTLAPPAPVINLPPPVINLPPPIQITIPPAPTITLPPAPAPPAPITPSYIWAIVIIGAVLVIALIILIVRSRRPV